MALSSGRPPSGIAVVRISGPAAADVAAAFGAIPLVPRRATLRALRSPADGSVLDRALCLWFVAPHSATGEDVLELHCHGGPALVDRIIADALSVPSVRPAEPGEFTLRAVLAGRMDLTAAEGLADLIEARTESERRRATRLAGGALSAVVDGWRSRLISLSAELEALIDFPDEGDVADRAVDGTAAAATRLACEIEAVLAASARAGKLTDGFEIVLAGPPNAGKSSLLNALVGRDAALVCATAGTTRDIVSVTLELGGYRVTLHDTAGIREGAVGIEASGIERTRALLRDADLVVEVRSPDTTPLCLGLAGLAVLHKADLLPADDAARCGTAGVVRTSVADGRSIARLREALSDTASRSLDSAEAALVTRARQRSALADVVAALRVIPAAAIEIKAEEARNGLAAIARLTGEIGIEHVLGEVFGRFCIGK